MKTILLLISTIVVVSQPAPAQDLAALFQKGLAEEEINRDPTAAIEQYSTLLAEFDKGRQLAATALFRIAECHRKLGDEKAAIKNLQQLVTLYPKQEKLVALARQNLTALGVAPSLPAPDGTEMSAEEAEAIVKYKTVLRDRPDITNGTRYISEAVKGNYATFTRLLLEKDADPNHRIQNISGRNLNGKIETMIEIATNNANLSIVKLLLNYGANVTPESLRKCIQAGYTNIEPLFLEAIKAKGEPFDYFPALSEAIKIDSDEAFKRLLANGASPKTLDENGVSLLHIAAKHGRAEVCTRLVKTHQLPVNQRDKEGHSALHYAAQKRSPETVKNLLKLGADPKAISETLIEAYGSHSGSPDAAKNISVLMQLFNYYHLSNYDHTTEEATEAIVSIIEQLVTAGIAINHQDSEGKTALHYAVNLATAAVPRPPTAVPRPPTAPGSRNSNPKLDISPNKNITKIFVTLLKGGADKNIKNINGTTVADTIDLKELAKKIKSDE